MGDSGTVLVVMTNGDKYLVSELDFEATFRHLDSRFWRVREVRSRDWLTIAIDHISTVVRKVESDERA